MDSTIFKTVAMLALMGVNGVLDAVIEHRKSLPEERQQRTVYLDYRPWEGEDLEALRVAADLMLSSSSRQPIIERCVPVRLGESPFSYIDLEAMQWNNKDLLKVLKTYQYSERAFPSIVRADWLLMQLADGHESNAYRTLLLSSEGKGETDQSSTQPENLSQLLEFFDVNEENAFGHIEASSGVNKVGTRLIKNLAIRRGYAWITYDAINLLTEFDPLENLNRNFKFDGSELIIGIPKISLETGHRGAAQVYFLSDGQGNLVDRAPVDLVEDHSRWKYAEIRSPGSCISCHQEGLNKVNISAYHQFLKTEAVDYQTYEGRLDVESFYGARIDSEITLANEAFALYVTIATKKTPEEAVAAFKLATKNYDQPLTLVTTAAELHTDPQTWARAIGAAGVGSNARIASLPGGGEISRDAWEQNYLKAVQMLQAVATEATADQPKEVEDEN